MFSPICRQIHRRTAGTEIVIWESFAVTMLTKCMLSDLRLKSIRVYWLLIKTNIKLGCCNLLKYFYPKSWGGGGGGGGGDLHIHCSDLTSHTFICLFYSVFWVLYLGYLFLYMLFQYVKIMQRKKRPTSQPWALAEPWNLSLFTVINKIMSIVSIIREFTPSMRKIWHGLRVQVGKNPQCHMIWNCIPYPCMFCFLVFQQTLLAPLTDSQFHLSGETSAEDKQQQLRR